MSYIAPTSKATNIIAQIMREIRHSDLPESTRFAMVKDLADVEEIINEQAKIVDMVMDAPPRRRMPAISVQVFGR